MTKVYGERWQISAERPLAASSQSEILRVVDGRGEFEGDYALKRVLRPQWHGRLAKEIEAVATLRHPNVIGMVDAAAFAGNDGAIPHPYLVMPIAGGGDLGERRRAETYRHSVDWILQVARQITSALVAANAAGIIHRDLKPANVLFTGQGQEIWLCDFGICLVREPARQEDADVWDEQQAFMAPELAHGLQLEVTPAADVYSLGKVLYFMYSGGQNAPHHLSGSSDHTSIFLKGKRCKLFGSLLSEMICPLQDRLKTVSEVEARLEAIARCE
ncbi:MAG TPA: protein kinase [Acidobacteriaceae bacterium]|jgi:serine/threonine protein kinase|nr:protein kinase [Acidobacteriaceae bacterium]